MSRYELQIECKACRDGNHDECTGRNSVSDNIVHIRCTCQSCKEKNTRSTTEANGIDISEQIGDRNVQALESVSQPLSTTNQSIQPFFMSGALHQENDRQ
jgi:hypothetical protein